MRTKVRVYVSCILAMAGGIPAASAFEPEEATIEGVHNAIKSGEVVLVLSRPATEGFLRGPQMPGG